VRRLNGSSVVLHRVIHEVCAADQRTRGHQHGARGHRPHGVQRHLSDVRRGQLKSAPGHLGTELVKPVGAQQPLRVGSSIVSSSAT